MELYILSYMLAHSLGRLGEAWVLGILYIPHIKVSHFASESGFSHLPLVLA
jgi:hypothetical protein